MSYNENAKKATMKYVKEKMTRIEIRYKTDEFEAIIEPAIKKSGIPVATFIKQAILEKIEHDKNIGSK